MPIIIFWFRRDLRLIDNRGLSEALNAAKQRGFFVLPIFIFDDAILNDLPKDDARVGFIHENLQLMHETLTTHQSGLLVKKGNVNDLFEQLIKQYDVRAVFTNRDYEPQAIVRDKHIKAYLNEKKIAWCSYKDQVIFEHNEVTKSDGKPYTVFTPYKKRWLATFDQSFDTQEYSIDLSMMITHKPDFPDLPTLGFSKSLIQVAPYEPLAIADYQHTRDFPAIMNGTTQMAPHLRFGTVSIRYWVDYAIGHNDTFLSELIWREFFMQILWHFPRVVNESFRTQYDAIKWRNNPDEFQAWCEGETGYPFVDAGMKELNTTGYMHNRVRMVTASFLCKHLLIDWRWGERYFAQKLLDYDLSANNGNWQWAAGTGCDASPYFRIFNPETQLKTFDANGDYVRQFVPNFDTINYPQPIVEHRFARTRCLEAYQKARLQHSKS